MIVGLLAMIMIPPPAEPGALPLRIVKPDVPYGRQKSRLLVCIPLG